MLNPDRYIDLVLQRRWLVLLFVSALLVLVGAGAGRVTVSEDFRDIIGKDNPQLETYDALQDTYSASNSVLVAIAPREGRVFTREVLGAIEMLTEAAWKAPHSVRVDSLTNFSHSRAEGDELLVTPLVQDPASLDDEALARIEKIALSAADLAGHLVSNDGRVAGLAINFVIQGDRGKATVEITDYLNSMLDTARASHPYIGYYMTGNVVLNRTISQAAKYFLESLLPIAALIIVVGATLLLRSIFGTLAIIVMVVFAIGTTMGFIGWIGVVVGPTTSGLPIIVMAIAIAHSVHIVTTTLAGMGDGLDKREAIAESLRLNIWPVFLTSITTMIGFLSLNTSDSPPFRELGNLVALGVFTIFLYSMTLLPALLSLLPLRGRRIRSTGSPFFEKFGDFVVARSKHLLWGIAILTVILLSGIPRLELSDNWTTQFDERYEIRRATDFIANNLTGLNSMDYSLSSGREGGVTDPAYLRKVESFAEWFRKQPEVTHVRAFSDIMKRLNRNMNGDNPEFLRLPDSSGLAAQYLLLYELSVPFGADLNDRIDIGQSATRLTVTVRGISARGLRELDQRAEAWLRANIPEFAAKAAGMTMIFAYLTQRNMESMLRGTLVGMALISFILIWIFRSLRLGLISLVPNFIPAAMAFGLWGHLVGTLGLAGTVMTVIAFGVVVDDTIHFMSKYLKARREGLAAPEAVRSAFRTVGHALWTTTVVLSAGFLVFASSGYDGSSTLGLMVTIAIVCGLITDFLLLPPLLMALDRRKA